MNKKNDRTLEEVNAGVSEMLEHFIAMLNSAWPVVRQFVSDDYVPYFQEDWLESNWELIVEEGIQGICNKVIRLETYGDGADANGASSRILLPNELPTHAIFCAPKSGGPEAKDHLSQCQIQISPPGWKLDRFVTTRDGWFVEEAPFDFTLIDNGSSSYVFRNEELSYSLEEI